MHGQLQPQWISPVGEQYLTKNEQIHRYIIKGDERATIWFQDETSSVKIRQTKKKQYISTKLLKKQKTILLSNNFL